VSGNTTDTLVYRYTVRAGDLTAALDVVDTRAAPYNIALESSMALVVSDFHPNTISPQPEPGQRAVTIMRNSAQPLLVSDYGLPVPGTASKSLSGRKTIEINTGPPVVLSLTTTHVNGTYGIGESIPLFVTFNMPVVVVGAPIIEMSTNNVECYTDRCNDATFVGGSGSTVLEFEYVIKFGDSSSALDYEAVNSLKLFSSWGSLVGADTPSIMVMSTTPETHADLSLPPPGNKLTVISPCSLVGCYHALAIQTDGLGVASVTTDLADGLYTWGTEINIYVKMTGPVNVVGVPELLLDLPLAGSAKYVSGSGGSMLRFGYLSVSTDYTLQLSYVDEYSLVLPPGSSMTSVTDSARHAVQTLAKPYEAGSLSASHKIMITGSQPKVTNMYVGGTEGCTTYRGDAVSKAVYGVGQKVELYMEFDQTVRVPSGVPRVLLNTGAYATYVSGSGTPTIKFEVVIEPGTGAGVVGGLLDVAKLEIDNEVDSVDVSNSMIVANSDAIVIFADTVHLPSAGSSGSLSANCDIEVNTAVVKVQKVEWLQKSGSYSGGEELSFKLTFAQKVQVGGTVTMELYTGEDTIPGIASYLSGGQGETEIIMK
jgi:hypothetical protein